MSRRNLLLALAAASCFLSSTAEAQSFYTSCSRNTGNSASFILPASINPSVDGQALSVGSEIAVFTPEGLCAGVRVWEGSNVAITVWGDDSMTSEKDGLEDGEEMQFRIWDASSGREYDNGSGSDIASYDDSKSYYLTDGLYRDDGIYKLASLSTASPLSSPASPKLTSPENGASGVATSLTFAWNEVETAERYDIRLSTAADFGSDVFEQTGITGTSHDVSGLSSEATYYWSVRAANADGASSWSETRHFTTGQETTDPGSPDPPASPSLASPEDGASGVETSLTLAWQAVETAESYQVEISPDADFSEQVMREGGLTATEYELSGLTRGATYYWRVRGERSDAIGAWSATRSFTTRHYALSQPQLISPVNGAYGLSGKVTLVWTASDDATTYLIQLSEQSDFSSGIKQNQVTGTSFEKKGLKPGATYYWRARAENADGASEWSEAYHFTLLPPPGTPVALSPSHGSTLDATTVSLNWEPVEGATGYRVEMDRLIDADRVVVVDSTVGAITQVTIVVAEDSEYEWRVQAIGEGGVSAWTEFLHFETLSPGASSNEPTQSPQSFRLEQNYPNPFNPSTIFPIELPREGHVSLTVYNSLGARVATVVSQILAAGAHKIRWEAGDLPSGMYFCVVEFEHLKMTRALSLVK